MIIITIIIIIIIIILSSSSLKKLKNENKEAQSVKTFWDMKEQNLYKEGNVLFHDTLNTFHLWLYGTRRIW